MHNSSTAGRIDASGWEDHEKTDPAISLPAHYFTTSPLDTAQLSAGSERALLATSTAIGPTIEWDAAAAALVDPAELPAIAWVP